MINIAIDGPSAAGKSSIAKSLAKKLNYIHLDTGAMYRLVAYIATFNKLALDDEDGIVKLLKDIKIDMKPNGDILLNDRIINNEIRTNEMSMAASKVSKNPKVREALVKMQQEIAKNKGYILDGRDIGTVVLKDAEVKIYLTASSKARAKRRVLENEQKGLETDFDMILSDIEKRDYQDMNRDISPLKQAKDAILVDSSDLNKEEVEEVILKIIKDKIGG